eukprot:1189030-Prorocentrum_minimum.AAC.1
MSELKNQTKKAKNARAHLAVAGAHGRACAPAGEPLRPPSQSSESAAATRPIERVQRGSQPGRHAHSADPRAQRRRPSGRRRLGLDTDNIINY